jgi:prenyltransferase beta subunit
LVAWEAMLRSRKIWLALAVAALVAVSFAASVVAARRATDPRTKYTTRALDYLHSRQTDSGGFSTPENTAWAILGVVAKRERQGASAWRVKGNSPFMYLQSSDLVAGASNGVENAPIYYSRLIMAYVASRNSNQVATAGSKSVNLLTELWKYQDMSDTSVNKGAFSALPGTMNSAAHSTAWAVLAMYNLEDDPASDPHFVAARTWLATQQNDTPGGDGGFSSSVQGQPSNVLDTALAIQALSAGSIVAGWDEALAKGFLKTHQNNVGGFSYSSQNGSTQTDATSAAIQAIIALGDDPRSWKGATKGNPYTALSALLQTNGSYRQTDRLGLLATTSWALIAQDVVSQPFTIYPKKIPSAVKSFRFRPAFNTISPKNGAKYKTHVVSIRATYTDHKGGTGIKPSACRLYVDNKNRSRSANIGKYGLHLQLKNVPNGDHTYEIQLRDHAGNTKVVKRTFVIAVPTPVPTHSPTSRPTYNPGPIYPTVYPTTTPKPYVTPTPTVTPTPYETVTPYPYTSPTTSASPLVTGSPIPSPSASASPAGAGGSGGGGSAAGFVGGTLLAMLPIGAVISYLLLHRREEILDTASQGAVLDGGGSAWERFKHTLARSKDLTRPSSRE